MDLISLSEEEIRKVNAVEELVFPKYTKQLMNIANRNAQATRPKVVGQLSEDFKIFLSSKKAPSIDEWRTWYIEHHACGIEKAVDKNLQMVEQLKEAMNEIDKDLIEKWITDLVITKTYCGMYFQKAILIAIAKKRGESVKPATPADESKGIDGYIGDVPISIKPISYKTEDALPEKIGVEIVYYKKTDDGLEVTYNNW